MVLKQQDFDISVQRLINFKWEPHKENISFTISDDGFSETNKYMLTTTTRNGSYSTYYKTFKDAEKAFSEKIAKYDNIRWKY